MTDHVPLKISVITICRNAQKTIERTIASVRTCDYPNLEYIVVDGASSDRTVKLLEDNLDCIDRMISEPDRGISDAMNKGIAMSSGIYHYLLHADDELNGDALRKLVSAAQGSPPVVVGSVRVMDGERMVRKFRPQPDRLTEKMAVPHMGCLVRRTVWEEIGGYDQTRKIAMDHLFMLKIYRRYGESAFRVVDTVVADYHLGGVSDRQVMRGFEEIRRNLRENGSGYFGAALAYYKLIAKSKIGKLIRGS